WLRASLEHTIVKSLIARRCSRCPKGWTFNNSKCYFVFLGQKWETRKSWKDSRLECLKMGADLLTIQNEEEQVRQSNELNHVSVTVLIDVITYCLLCSYQQRSTQDNHCQSAQNISASCLLKSSYVSSFMSKRHSSHMSMLHNIPHATKYAATFKSSRMPCR
uniref:C-type lectin domain-containing protein n=1 Tax=Paramormyrops kingsleyae TaxID=1676925 RepID=A0A3B3R4E3_9TELE